MKLTLLFLVVFACVLQALALPVEYADDDDIQTEFGKKLKKHFEDLLEQLKDSIEKGKALREDFMDKLKDVREKMKESKVEITEKAKELLGKIKERAKEYFDKILERLGLKAEMKSLTQEAEIARLDFNIKDIFRKLKKALLDQIDKEALKQKIHDLFGKGNEMADSLLEMLKGHGEKGKQKLLELVDRFLKDQEDQETEKRSLKELWDKVKEYFENLKIDIKEKYAKFGEWVKENVKKGVDHSKSKIENLREIAKEFVEHTKTLSKDVAAEALEFLRPYHEDLGSLWDQVKDSVKEVLNRKD